MAISSRRREGLLELVHALRSRLEVASIPRLVPTARDSDEERGMPGSVAGHAAGFLSRTRDLDLFKQYLRLSDEIDRTSGQNARSPRAHHRVFRQEIERFLATGEVSTAEELLYVLSWLRRTLPKSPEKEAGGGRRAVPKGQRPRRLGPTRPDAFPPLRERPDLPKPGTSVVVVLLAERTSKGGWRAKHLGTGIEGHVHNWAEMPAGLQVGTELELTVASATEKVIAFRYVKRP